MIRLITAARRRPAVAAFDATYVLTAALVHTPLAIGVGAALLASSELRRRATGAPRS